MTFPLLLTILVIIDSIADFNLRLDPRLGLGLHNATGRQVETPRRCK